jgi:hypothetical protein
VEPSTTSDELNDFGLVPQFFWTAKQRSLIFQKRERYLNNNQIYKENRTAALVEWQQLCAN